MNRRNFLKLSAVAAAGVAAIPFVAKSEYDRQPPLTYYCVGCGFFVFYENSRGHALPKAIPGTYGAVCRYADYSTAGTRKYSVFDRTRRGIPETLKVIIPLTRLTRPPAFS